MTTPLPTATLEELEQAATPGPWGSADETYTGADAAFIAAIRNVTPELLAVVAAARDHECRGKEWDATASAGLPTDGPRPACVMCDRLAALDAKDGAS